MRKTVLYISVKIDSNLFFQHCENEINNGEKHFVAISFCTIHLRNINYIAPYIQSKKRAGQTY